MKNYQILVPIKGTIEIFIEAENKEEALEGASDVITLANIIDWQEDMSLVEIEEI